MANSVNKDVKPSLMALALMKLWHSLMISCTAILSFFAFVLKDGSAFISFVLGVFGLCLPSIVRLFRAINLHLERKRKHAEQLRTIELERLKQARERERERLEQEELYAKREIAENEAIKDVLSNVNIAAFRPN
jgi:hypothetical protein